jgi:hypothetical protein
VSEGGRRPHCAIYRKQNEFVRCDSAFIHSKIVLIVRFQPFYNVIPAEERSSSSKVHQTPEDTAIPDTDEFLLFELELELGPGLELEADVLLEELLLAEEPATVIWPEMSTQRAR